MKTLKNQWQNKNKQEQTQQAILKVEYSTKNARHIMIPVYLKVRSCSLACRQHKFSVLIRRLTRLLFKYCPERNMQPMHVNGM